VNQLLGRRTPTVSADGAAAAGDQQSMERPFGHADPGGLMAWAVGTASWPDRTDPGWSRGLDNTVTPDSRCNIGAEIMERNTYGPQRGLVLLRLGSPAPR